jgi:hypothetical protein
MAKVFISYSPAEEALAKYLAGWIQRALIIPDSSSNDWIQFEAGIVTGANDYENLVPVIYGGMNVDSIPATVRDLQALILNEPAVLTPLSQNAFFPEGSRILHKRIRIF